MKKILLLIITISITFILSGCGKDKKYNYKLTINSNAWSGWTEGEYDSDHLSEEYIIKKNKVYNVRKGHSFSFNFEVTKITKEGINIKTNTPLVSDGNMMKLEYEFIIELDKKYTLSSPTYDAGCTYYIELNEI